MSAFSPEISPIIFPVLLRHLAIEIIKHLHILELITLDVVVLSVFLQLILVQPQSLPQTHYYLDYAKASRRVQLYKWLKKLKDKLIEI